MTRLEFMQGNVACAEGALAAGCTFFAGYPITPSTEVAEHMAAKLPKRKGCFIQMEDEIASMAAIIGAAWTGVRAMTATSGPGFSLMMENIGYAVMSETPCVLINVQRGGPSTGQPTMAAQGDMMQVRFGSHGDFSIIALAPSTVQECFELTAKAFNLADQFRCPVFLMADEVIGHMRERITIPDSVQIVRPKPLQEGMLPFAPEDDLIPGFAAFGTGRKIPVTGLTHNEKGYPDSTNPARHESLVRRLVDKIETVRHSIADYEIVNEEAEYVFVCYGSPVRTVQEVVQRAKTPGTGYLHLRMIWPFPEQLLSRFPNVKAFIVPELNLGMISREVERHVCVPVISAGKIGGELHAPDELVAIVEQLRSGGCP
ncbi:MAG: 2-oxoacid:acceptor oxidoreductase subunit alpha [Methanospirillum sp.]|uniref:2-oxoacid:acceptor oxidoreductase subunit alpha n=1 Tax=Methanospirillum sp. TaxID=45200 RepID=UPI00236CA979|nr:2-oxoacid:acceptor oxidoreductase subunit alpha [Methanospirillum sp.]MDD1729538.1 2-oxoacid:acceptor oxidoreductase subunit alpha [Methanospirillum sp.]